MKLYTDKVTAQTSHREHSIRAKKAVKELNLVQGKFKLIGKNNTIFTFKTEDKMNAFREDFKHYFE